MKLWQLIKNLFISNSPMASSNDATSTSTSHFQRTVTLRDWWLTKPKPDDVTQKTIGVAGIVSSQNNRAERCFSTAPILKVNGIVELETVDGVCVILQGFINEERTLENGFSAEVFKHFLFGFPIYWENFATSFPKGESADKAASQACEDGKDSFEGHADILDNLNGNPQDFDSCTVDMGLREPEDTGLSNKTSSVLNASSNNIPHEHVIESGHEVLFEKSPVGSEFEDDSSLRMGPSSMDLHGMKHNVARNVTVSSTISKCSAVSSSRRMTRSMSKTGKVTLIDLDDLGSSDILKGKRNALSNKKTVNITVMGESKEILSTSVGNQEEQNVNNIDSNISAVCRKGSNEENKIKLKRKRKRKQNDPDVKVTRKKLTFEVDISNQGINEVRDVRGESQVGTRKSDIEANHSNVKCSDPLSGSSVGVGCSVNAFTEKFNFASSVTDPNENTVLSRTNMKIGQNKKKNNKDMFGSSCREDTHNTPTSARHEIDSQEARLTQSKSKRNLKSGNSAERRRIAISPKSPKTTPKAKKGSKDTYRSPTILSPESFSGKKSRSGRVLLPPLDFWRNQKVLYDLNRQLYGVEEPM
ncbi:hypothetical protein CTI12_AA146970 [Artemisia annua]|uniref:SANTA domain-containing protein n=1 Tax=Artemisia annua TaxID=35608 RepID=A0A2U1PJ50_ARTAN|nr:hypothetical protein CTI12_AA146970 [Artemisia annua]